MPDALKAISTLQRLMKIDPSLFPPSLQSAPGGVRRRDFVKIAIATGVGFSVNPGAWAVETRAGVPYRKLGKTGENVSMVGLGGAHIGQQKDPKESIEIIRAAIDGGINFMDNSWDYNGGASEMRMGQALKDGYRDKVFLMTKIDGRTRESFDQQLNESLTRLQTDRVDLLQFHEIIRMEDAERIFAPGGAMEAMIAAKKAGKVRYIGFTGHKSPDIHLKMLETAAAHGFTFDTVQMPLNVMDAHFASFGQKVLPVLVKQNIGVLGMKSMGDKFILDSKVVTPIECLHYAMNLPVSVVITGCDSMKILTQALEAARTFKPLSETEVAAILAKTSPVAMEGKFELYKTSVHFDSTVAHPDWLG
ncbi:MAG: aldo/keto reductase [Chthoniobacteraceae bacterium]|nr:aldo/keto reductase [Chthoniobacteraceae bacterium]